jgi:hypothetical protein
LDYAPTLFKWVLAALDVKTTANGVMRKRKAAFAVYLHVQFARYEEEHCHFGAPLEKSALFKHADKKVPL